jgi:hypothetical protein
MTETRTKTEMRMLSLSNLAALWPHLLTKSVSRADGREQRRTEENRGE